MKFYRIVTFVILILATSAYASQSNVVIYEQFDDIKVVAVINEKDIENSPKWHPGSEPLPLSVDDAIKAMHDFISQPKVIGSIEEIEIRTLKDFPGYWHYLFKVAASEADSRRHEMYLVLMSGKVIPAFIEPESIK